MKTFWRLDGIVVLIFTLGAGSLALAGGYYNVNGQTMYWDGAHYYPVVWNGRGYVYASANRYQAQPQRARSWQPQALERVPGSDFYFPRNAPFVSQSPGYDANYPPRGMRNVAGSDFWFPANQPFRDYSPGYDANNPYAEPGASEFFDGLGHW